jgi:hypothetical protein
LLCRRNITRLGILVSSAQYYHKFIAISFEVHTVPRSMMDAHFADTFADRSSIAFMPELQTINAVRDFRQGNPVAQS